MEEKTFYFVDYETSQGKQMTATLTDDDLMQPNDNRWSTLTRDISQRFTTSIYPRFCRSLLPFLVAACLLFLVYLSGISMYHSNFSQQISKETESLAEYESWNECSAVKDFQQLISLINSHSSRLFLADPVVLDSLIHPEENPVFDCQILGQNISVLNFGLISSNDVNETNDICHLLRNTQFTCRIIEKSKIRLLDREMVTHFTIESSHVQVHVACFIKVLNNVFWVQRMQQKRSGSMFARNQDEVYDSFEIRMTEFPNGLNVTVPRDVESFLNQVESSHFVDCNRKVAQSFPLQEDQKSQKVQENTRQSIIQMKRLTNRVQMPFFLMSGSLLGWYRECHAIAYTTDADFGTWARYATPEMERKILQVTHSDPSFRAFYIFGSFDMGYEMSFLLRNNFKSDLFFLYNESRDRLSSSGHVYSKRLYYKYYYPSFRLCSTIFLNERVNVPCEPEKILSAEYGTWWTPVKDSEYSYKTSARNRGPAIHYPANMPPLREFP